MSKGNNLVTVAQAAKVLGVRPQKLHGHIRRDGMPFEKRGSMRFVDLKKTALWLAEWNASRPQRVSKATKSRRSSYAPEKLHRKLIIYPADGPDTILRCRGYVLGRVGTTDPLVTETELHYGKILVSVTESLLDDLEQGFVRFIDPPAVLGFLAEQLQDYPEMVAALNKCVEVHNKILADNGTRIEEVRNGTTT